MIHQDQIGGWGLEGYQAAKKYLLTVDRCCYQECWIRCDKLLQLSVKQADWESDLKTARDRLGKLSKRELKSQQLVWDPVGLPKGQYLQIEFSSSFEKKGALTERLTMKRDIDDSWKVLMYQIHDIKIIDST